MSRTAKKAPTYVENEVKIVLKTKKAIKATTEVSDVEEDNGAITTDGIAWDDSKFHKNHKLVALDNTYGTLDVCVDAAEEGSWLALAWIKHFEVNGHKVTPENIKGTRYLVLPNGKYFDLTDRVEVEELKLCSCCEEVVLESSGLVCSSCVDKLTKKKDYNYVPDYNFFGEQIENDKENPVWYGLELEYGITNKYPLAVMMNKHEGRIYLKSDSSIHGGSFQAEMVSHPHSFKELMSERSFIKDLPTLDIDQQTDANGCHIHVSRTSFVDDKHYGLFYFLVSQSQQLAEYVANRKETSFCRFSTDGVISTKQNLKAADGQKRRAVNEKHDDTVEIRIFNSTNKVEEVNSYLQFIESMLKYTKYAKATVTLKGWLAYAKRYPTKYADVLKKMEAYEGDFSTSIKYKAPKEYNRTAANLRVNEIGCISEIVTNTTYERGETTITVDKSSGPNVKDCGSRLEIRCAQNGWVSVNLSSITSMKLVK